MQLQLHVSIQHRTVKEPKDPFHFHVGKGDQKMSQESEAKKNRGDLAM